MSIQYCSEHDSVGERSVSKDAYYGVQSLRTTENFPVTGLAVRPKQVDLITEIEKASAITNLEIGLLDKRVADATIWACNEIAAGRLHEALIVDPIQGGAGASLNMNINEAIANRTIELLGGEEGDYAPVSPNDHVNYGQPTNGVFSSTGKLAVLKLLVWAQIQLEWLPEVLEAKVEEFDDVFEVGRTQMQDTVPIRLGQEFWTHSRAVHRDITRFERAKDGMRRLNMGGTAIGTDTSADEWYPRRIVPSLFEVTRPKLAQVSDLIGAARNLDGPMAMSGAVRTYAVNLSKMFNDLRLMSSGPRCGFSGINLSPRQNSSPIMPGKVNPAIPEAVNQVTSNIIGDDVAVAMATEAGQLEFNASEPTIFYNLVQSMEAPAYTVHTLVDSCVTGIAVSQKRCQSMVEHSMGIITALHFHVGHEKAAKVVKRTIETGAPMRWLILEEGLLGEAALNKILDPCSMTESGTSGKELPKE